MNSHSYNITVRRPYMYINDLTVENMENTLKVAGDKTRIKILFTLLDEFDVSSDNNSHLIEKCVNDIAKQINASQSLVSHQLKVLKESNFVKIRKEGTKVYYSLKDEHVREIIKITYEHVIEENDNND